jgi:hypothetical protein
MPKFISTLCNLIKMNYLAKNNEDPEKNDADQNSLNLIIAPIKQALRGSLTSIASKLLSSEHITIQDLSKEERILRNSFDNRDIYRFITGEPDCIPEF